jgi:hypothetical protein
VHDLEVCVVQQRLEVGAREALRGVGEMIKVDVMRYGTFLACACKIYIKKGRGGGTLGIRKGAYGRRFARASLRSSFVGMLHSSDLSSRPGRRRAESIRSGRLEMTGVSRE